MPFSQARTTANPIPTSLFPTSNRTHSNFSDSTSANYMPTEAPPQKGVRWAERLEYDVPPRRRFPSSAVRAGILTRRSPIGARESQASTSAALFANTHANGLRLFDLQGKTSVTLETYVAALERQYEKSGWWELYKRRGSAMVNPDEHGWEWFWGTWMENEEAGLVYT